MKASRCTRTMGRAARWFLGAMLLTGALCCGGGSSAEAQVRSEQMLNVFLPAPRELRQYLTRARKALDDEIYSDAVEQLGRLLDEDIEEIPGEAQDFFIGPVGEPGTQTSIKAEAQRLLGLMPAKGLELYELQFGAKARMKLDAALDSGDIRKLTEVTRKYFHTQAGHEATLLMGRVQLDQGRPLAAALSLKRLADTPAAAARYEPELSLLLATAWLSANQPESARAALVAMKNRRPGVDAVRIGGRDVKLFPDDSQALAWLEAIVGAQHRQRSLDAAQWVMHRGDPARNASGVGGLPLFTHRWKVPTSNDPTDERLIQQRQQQYLAQGTAALPGFQPLAVGDYVLMRTPERLVAVDFITGKRKWEYPWFESDGQEAMQSSRGARPGSGDSRSQELGQRIWEDAAYGQLSSDGEFVFLLHDIGFAERNNYSQQLIIRRGIAPADRQSSKSNNLLAALELRTEGKLRWMIGGDDGLDEPRLAGAFFLGAPLALQGQLYALAEFSGEIRLVVLDVKSGRLEWQQQLAHLERREIERDPARRLAGASPSFADGVLICPTSAGAVVAVDLATRSLLWGYQYNQVPLMLGNRRVIGPHSMPAKDVGDRWSDATVTIADGCVLITPVESDKLYCLDLLTGLERWPAQNRGSMLYVACVHEGNVILVGTNSLNALRLSDGKEAWSQPIALDGELPSGRGFYSEQCYFLPTTGNRLAKIDLQQGKLVGDVKMAETLGNLICYKDEVISHNVDHLVTFYQIDPLRERVAQRLARDPKDEWALVRNCELLLQDGNRPAALVALRKAYEAIQKPESRAVVQTLLVDTLLAALREDFSANRQFAREVASLIDQPAQQDEYLRLMALGWMQMGAVPDSFEAFLALIDSDFRPTEGDVNRADFESVERDLRVRRDRWIRGQIAQLLESASPDQRPEMDKAIQQRLDAALVHESPYERQNQLRRFAEFFATHPLANRARLELARALIKNDDLLRAELLLVELTGSNEQAVRGEATAHMAALLERTGWYQESAEHYRKLADHWGDTVLLDGKTGLELFEAAMQNAQLKQSLAEADIWPYGRATAKEGSDLVNQSQTFRVFPATLREQQGPLPAGISISSDHNRILVRDGLGAIQQHVALQRQTRFYSANFGVTYAKAYGHLIVASLGLEMVAIDALHRGEGESSPLWQHELVTTFQRGNLSRQPINTRTVSNPFGATRYLANGPNGKPVGASGPLTSAGICYQSIRELICVDPLSGDAVWSRSNIEEGSDLFGDDRLVFVAPPAGNECLVLNAIDGRLLGKRQVPPVDQRWTTHGRRVLVTGQSGTTVSLTLRDAWEQRDIWSREYMRGSQGCLVGQDAVAVLEPGGQFEIRSLQDDRVLLAATVNAEDSLSNIYVFRTPQQYLLMANRGVFGDSPLNVQSVGIGLHVPLVSGYLYAFDRQTAAPSWPVPAYIDRYGLPLDQPADAPVLTFMRHIVPERNQNRPAPGYQTSILAIDKRDGRIVFAKDDISVRTYNYDIVAQPEKNNVVVMIPGKMFTIQFTDEPRPPEPPAQTGAAGSPGRQASTVTDRMSNVAEVILDALGRQPVFRVAKPVLPKIGTEKKDDADPFDIRPADQGKRLPKVPPER